MISFLGTMTFITISTFCYITIFIKLFHHQAQIQGQVLNAQHNNVGNQLNISRYRKTVSSALFVQLTLVVCYTPFGVERGFIATNRHVSSFAAQIAWSLVALNQKNHFVVCSELHYNYHSHHCHYHPMIKFCQRKTNQLIFLEFWLFGQVD